MANEPRLVKPDGTTQTPSETPMTRSEFMELMKAQSEAQLEMVRMMFSAQQTQQATNDENMNALALLIKKSKEDFERNDENYLKTFKNRSVFNPRGENGEVGGVPRNPLKGEIFWVGTKCVWHEHTYEEIQLMNQLESGTYHNGDWIVRDMEPDVKGSRKLYVHFQNLDPDKRAELPSGYWDAQAKNDDGTPMLGQDLNNPLRKGRQVTGMEIMLREMVEEAAARVPATA